MRTIPRPKSLTELVSEALRDWIISGDLDLGSQLSEARIASELQVSRTPVREAINRLEMEGLLVVEPQRGSFVFSLEPKELAKLCDARLCLESAALSSAIASNAEKLAERLKHCVEEMAAAREKGGAPRENCEGEIDRRRAPPRDIHPMNRLTMSLALSIGGRPQMRREH